MVSTIWVPNTKYEDDAHLLLQSYQQKPLQEYNDNNLCKQRNVQEHFE